MMKFRAWGYLSEIKAIFNIAVIVSWLTALKLCWILHKAGFHIYPDDINPNFVM